MKKLLVILIIAIILAGCGRGMDRHSAERFLQQAAALEESGNPVAAYRIYKLVEGTYETNDALRSDAWDGAQRTRAEAENMEREITDALVRYHDAHGAYPAKLADVAPMLPERLVRVLPEFHIYENKKDGSMRAQANLIMLHFNLRD